MTYTYTPDSDDVATAAEAVDRIDNLAHALRIRIRDLASESRPAGRDAIATELEETVGSIFARTAQASFALTRQPRRLARSNGPRTHAPQVGGPCSNSSRGCVGVLRIESVRFRDGGGQLSERSALVCSRCGQVHGPADAALSPEAEAELRRRNVGR